MDILLKINIFTTLLITPKAQANQGWSLPWPLFAAREANKVSLPPQLFAFDEV